MTPRHPFAIIPAKQFARGKSRLGARLGDVGRARVARALFEHVLETARSCPQLAATLVATDGAEVADLASSRGAHVLLDPVPAAPSLAAVVDRALDRARALGADAALILMADLPHVACCDLVELLAHLGDSDVVLAGDARGECTNALALRLGSPALRSAFGQPQSLALHQASARALGLSVRVVDNPRLAWDVDLPTDLDAVARSGQDW